MGLRRTFTGTSLFSETKSVRIQFKKVKAGNLPSHFWGNTRLRKIDKMKTWDNMRKKLFKHPGDIVLSTCAPGIHGLFYDDKVRRDHRTTCLCVCVCASMPLTKLHAVCHLLHLHIMCILDSDSVLKWWYPSLYWTICEWVIRGYPYSRKPPHPAPIIFGVKSSLWLGFLRHLNQWHWINTSTNIHLV